MSRMSAPCQIENEATGLAECRQIVRELVSALELCLQSDGLSWEAEHEADILVTRHKKPSQVRQKASPSR